jgi:hypothetical protein
MSEVYLNKVMVMYFSSSGPGTSRSITFCEDVLMLREDCTIEKNKYSKPPVRTAVKISEEATNDLNEYAVAFKELEEAQKKFASAKKVFMESEGGKELITILRPQKDKLTPEEVFDQDEVFRLTKLVEKEGDCLVTGDIREVAGYNYAELKLKLDKPVLMSKLDKITNDGYKCARHGFSYKDTPEGKMVTTAYYIKDGTQYPPYREDDYFEVAKAEQEMRERLDQ